MHPVHDLAAVGVLDAGEEVDGVGVADQFQDRQCP